MHRPIAVPVAFFVLVAAILLGVPCRAEDRVVVSYPYVPGPASHRITSVDPATREVVIDRGDGDGFFWTSEGPAILALSSTGEGAPDTAVRLEITEILDDGTVRGTFGPGAAGIVVKGPASLGRPFDGDVAKSFRSNWAPRPAATKARSSAPAPHRRTPAVLPITASSLRR